MRSFNVALAILVSLLLAAAVLEVGLRVIGLGPQPTINRFEPSLGWVKTPGATSVRKTREFDVRYTINSLGLRDDEMSSPAKPAGTYRVVMLGDSFVLGYTVDRSDLFVDLLEQWWKREGRAVDVINAGTEGWSTDQEAAWLLDHGREFQPDLVVLFPYENDIYWNGEIRYVRVPKPRFTIAGEKEMRVLEDPGERSKVESSALGKLFLAKPPPPALWSPDGIHALQGEQQVYFEKPDPSFEKEAIGRTRGSLIALKKQCEALGAKLVAVPIPNKACVDADAKPKLASAINALSLRQSIMFWKDHPDVDPKTWSPDRPVDTFVRLCGEVGIETLDPREFLRAQAHPSAENAEGRLYYAQDWHFDPHGNRALARYLHKELDEDGLVPKAPEGGVVADLPPRVETKEFPPRWAKFFAALWVVLSVGYALTYRDEPKLLVPIKVGALLGLVFTIAIGGGMLLAQLPRGLSMLVGFAFVAGVLTFVAVKLGRRLKTITELFVCFVGRGHWYLMPLVVVLLTVGSLLVVAASSPLIAPFIYTLF